MIRIPWAVPPRVRAMIPMMMAAIATGQTRIQVPHPTIGMKETTIVSPRRIQLIIASIAVGRFAGCTIEAFGRTGATGAGWIGAGAGAGIGAGVGAAGGGMTTPDTPESGAQPAAPSYQARSGPAKVRSANLP